MTKASLPSFFLKHNDDVAIVNFKKGSITMTSLWEHLYFSKIYFSCCWNLSIIFFALTCTLRTRQEGIFSRDYLIFIENFLPSLQHVTTQSKEKEKEWKETRKKRKANQPYGNPNLCIRFMSVDVNPICCSSSIEGGKKTEKNFFFLIPTWW